MVGVGHFHPAYRPYDEFDHESDSEMEINDQVDGLNLRISHVLENFIPKKLAYDFFEKYCADRDLFYFLEREIFRQKMTLKKARKILRSGFIRCDQNPGR